MGKSLMDRAKEVVKGAGVATALVIAPLGACTDARADSIQFLDKVPSTATGSGGNFGHIGQCLLFGNTALKMTGDSSITGLNSSDSGFLSARQAASNSGLVSYDWGRQIDSGDTALCGTIAKNSVFNINTNFSYRVNPGSVHDGDPPITYTPDLTWKLTVTLATDSHAEDINYVISSDDVPTSLDGTVAAFKSFSFDQEETGVTWSATLQFNWNLHTDSYGQVIDSNPEDRLEVHIPSAASLDNSMYVSFDQLEAGAPAAPLPATLWMGGALLSTAGIGRIRKIRRNLRGC